MENLTCTCDTKHLLRLFRSVNGEIWKEEEWRTLVMEQFPVYLSFSSGLLILGGGKSLIGD